MTRKKTEEPIVASAHDEQGNTFIRRKIFEVTGKVLVTPDSLHGNPLEDKVIDGIIHETFDSFYHGEGYEAKTTKGSALKRAVAAAASDITPGHGMCPGCPECEIVRAIQAASEEVARKEGMTKVTRLSVVNTGCMTASTMSTLFGTAWVGPAIRPSFGTGPAVACGYSGSSEVFEGQS